MICRWVNDKCGVIWKRFVNNRKFLLNLNIQGSYTHRAQHRYGNDENSKTQVREGEEDLWN